MHIRYLKLLFVIITSLMALIYVSQNIVNASAAHQSILYVMAGADHSVYPNSFGPKFSSPVMAWIALVLIFSLEYLAGFLLAFGAWHMWRARHAQAEDFRAAQKLAEIGAGVGVLVWFGLFGVIGSAFFQMWQTQVGTGSMNGAFQFFVSCALTLLFLNQRDN